jgi:hypothetical protein
MLSTCAETLPRTDLTYLAFRAAFCETLERMVLARQINFCGDWVFGYLTEVPFLTQVAPQVQLDLLVETWSRHIGPEEQAANFLDESVIFAACETAARLVRNDPVSLARFLNSGPQDLDVALRPRLAHSLVATHLTLSRDASFLLITQFLDLPPREARTLKAEFGILPAQEEPLFEALGRWRVSPDFAARAEGLLTPKEIAEVTSLLQETGCLAG